MMLFALGVAAGIALTIIVGLAWLRLARDIE